MWEQRGSEAPKADSGQGGPWGAGSRPGCALGRLVWGTAWVSGVVQCPGDSNGSQDCEGLADHDSKFKCGSAEVLSLTGVLSRGGHDLIQSFINNNSECGDQVVEG